GIAQLIFTTRVHVLCISFFDTSIGTDGIVVASDTSEQFNF
ncbi:MAG: hypothetical protein JWQ40_4725, partial [Segetibacter sp.]|nr:hypothetical protein [Segetibacter sp.]